MDNSRFLRWTTRDWKDSWKYVDYTQPVWSKEMRDTFGLEADLILTDKQIEKAVQVLYLWRRSWGMEERGDYYNRLRDLVDDGSSNYPEEKYGSCSAYTRAQGDILVSYIKQYCCDERALNYYPMLDDLNEWITLTYSKTAMTTLISQMDHDFGEQA